MMCPRVKDGRDQTLRIDQVPCVVVSVEERLPECDPIKNL
jgi:hypothetical protein